MKKVFLAFAFIAALLVTSCKKAETAETTETTVVAEDSTKVEADTTCVDSVNVDTTKAAELEK